MTRLTDRIPYVAAIDRPKLTLPGGKRLAVWVILNVEEWSIAAPHATHHPAAADGAAAAA